MVWTLLQVSVAVLLDNFVTEQARSQLEEDSQCQLARSKIEMKHVLDPLLTRFVRTYVNDDDMSLKLRKLFLALNGSAAVDMTAGLFSRSVSFVGLFC